MTRETCHFLLGRMNGYLLSSIFKLILHMFQCAGYVGLSIDEVHMCATTRKGYLLMLTAEIDTKDKTHGPRFVPSYVFDDVIDLITFPKNILLIINFFS